MNYSRRDLSLLMLPLLAAEKTSLPSKTFAFESLPVRQNGPNRGRAILQGETHSGYPIEMHSTELAPGQSPHPPHRHEHEEVFFLRQGTLEVNIAGKIATLGPGSIAYVNSNDEHGVRNTGTEPAHYFVVALGRAPAAG